MRIQHQAKTNARSSEAGGQMGAWAPYYDGMMRLITLGRERTLRKMTVELAQVQPGDKVLEVGCGTGTLTLAAQARAGQSGVVHGIDAAPEMIAVARRKAARAGAPVNFQVGQIACIPFQDDEFDVVLCSFMIFHMPDDVRRKGLVEICRVLKPGGRLLVVDLARPTNFAQRSQVAILFGHMLRHDLEELVPEMAEAGFAEIETGPTTYPMVSFVRGRAGKV
jgi:ubiquinone/menaquinone biosynthesis C-methylase UbiE